MQLNEQVTTELQELIDVYEDMLEVRTSDPIGDYHYNLAMERVIVDLKEILGNGMAVEDAFRIPTPVTRHLRIVH